MNYGWHDLLGNIGVALILLAYALLQMQRIVATDWRYSLANAVGAVLILISLTVDFNLSALIIEIAWLIISLFGLWQSWRRSTTVVDRH